MPIASCLVVTTPIHYTVQYVCTHYSILHRGLANSRVVVQEVLKDCLVAVVATPKNVACPHQLSGKI